MMVADDIFVEKLVAMDGFLIGKTHALLVSGLNSSESASNSVVWAGGRQQLRMWMILGPPFESRECLPPTDSPLTEFNESEIFAGAEYFSSAGTLAWAEIIGR